MLMSDLQKKDIVNTTDGSKLGRIVDLEVLDDGTIKNIIIEPVKILKKITYGREINITFKQIVTIGSDVILVDLKL